jgi:hypothetical protein
MAVGVCGGGGKGAEVRDKRLTGSHSLASVAAEFSFVWRQSRGHEVS